MRPQSSGNTSIARDVLTAELEEKKLILEEKKVAAQLASESIDVRRFQVVQLKLVTVVLTQTTVKIEDIFIGMGVIKS